MVTAAGAAVVGSGPNGAGVVAGPVARLGRLLLLTDRRQARRPLVEVVRAATRAGARTVVLREKDLPPDARAALADALWPVLEEVGGNLIIAHGVGGAGSSGSPRVASGGPTPGYGSGIHLSARAPLPERGPARPGRRPALLGRSCHDAEELARAVAEGVEYVTVSPVFASISKPGYGPALGPAGLAGLCHGHLRGHGRMVAVYALGGVTSPDRVSACLRAGASGVAVMGQVMRADDPERTVRDLLGGVP